MARIRFDHVTKRFGDVTVVAGLDLEIADGEFFTFVGPSGCGKSTVLSMLAGIAPLDAGGLYFDDQAVDALPPAQRDVAMVFQSYALYPHMTVRENLAFPLRNRRMPRAQIDGEVQRIAPVLGLEALLARRPRELSGGQRQRVALGRALIRRPRVFLMDEPLSNLDARLRLEMREELKRLHERYRITTVYVTHDQEEAMALSDRVAVLDRGRIQQCGTPAEVYAAPANRFVAGFIGSPPMNFLDVACLTPVPALAPRLAAYAGRDLLVGVRPADIGVQVQPADDALAAEVLLLEPTGSDVWVVGEWNGTRLKGRADAGAQLVRGARAYFRIPPGRLHVFERASGRRMD